MANKGYGNAIGKYINDQNADFPITTNKVCEFLTKTQGLEPKAARKLVNVKLKRLNDSGQLARTEKGVYYKVRQTLFGPYIPGQDIAIGRQLMYDDDNVIGYETGPSLLNRLGMVSIMPKDKYIATNRYRKRLPAKTKIRICHPLTEVTEGNYKYLQVLDAIREMDKYPIDVLNPEQILRRVIEEFGLVKEELIWLARKYCNEKVVIRTVDIALGEFE